MSQIQNFNNDKKNKIFFYSSSTNTAAHYSMLPAICLRFPHKSQITPHTFHPKLKSHLRRDSYPNRCSDALPSKISHSQ